VLGYPDQALKLGEQGLQLAERLSHPYTLARGLYWNTLMHQFRREPQVVHERIDTALPVATDHGIAIVLAVGPIMRGWALAMKGEGIEGITQIQQGLSAYQATGAVFQQPHFLAILAEAYGRMDQFEEGLSAIGDALALVEQTEERYYEAELYRLQGEFWLRGAKTKAGQAEKNFQKALDIARHQQAKSWELRAATSLARLWRSKDKRQDAYDLLAPVYEWFTEGFDTADLMEAKSLLEELS